MINQRHINPISLFNVVVLIICTLYSSDAPAPPPGPTAPPINIACDTTADYTIANLNEIKSKGGASNPSVEFVEVKILADNTDISGWEICFSDNPTKEDCTEMGLGDGTWHFGGNTGDDDDSPDGNTEFDNGAYLIYDAKNVKADAGEILLRSSVGGESGTIVLDYIRYDNTPGICGDGNERWNITDDNGSSGLDITVLGSEPDDYTACSACFDSRDPNQKDFARSEPDGTGDWGNNGDTPSEGSTNDTGGTSGSFTITFNNAPGSTCSTDSSLDIREPVSITVLNNGGNPLTNFDGVIELSTNTGHGSWFTTEGDGGFSLDPPQNTGTLTDSTLDDGFATYDFDPDDSGTITLYLANEHAETVQVTVTDQSDPGVFSSLGGLSFSDNIFVVSVVEPNAPFNTSPDDLVPIAGRPHQLQIEMMRRDTSITPNDCGPASSYAETSVKTWYTTGANHPAGAAAPSLNATSLTTSEPSDPTADNFPITFTAGVASFNLITTDVGQFTLHFKDDLGSFITNDIISDPISFTVRPFGFDIDTSNLRFDDWTDNSALDDSTGVDSTYAADENGSVFTKAGEDFTVTVTAVTWDTNDDDGDSGGTADDGVPDPEANLTDNSATNSFGQELITPATVDITHSVILPASPPPEGIGTLTGGSNVGGFSNGAANATLTFDEVGIIALSANHINYLSSSVEITGTAQNYGRFTPYVFESSVNTPAFTPGCGTFTYIGQEFTYATNPVISLTARAKGTAPAYGNKTDNYTGNFFKLTDAKLLSSGSKTYSVAAGSLDLGKVMLLATDPVITNNSDGTATLTFNDGGGIAFNRGSPEDPFDADIALSINVLDEDDVFAGNADGTTANPLSFGTATTGISFGGNKEQRWGRLLLENAFGSELLPLEIPIRAEYQSSGDFITNSDDNCTSYDGSNITFSNANGVTIGVNLTASGNGTLINGVDDDANSLIITNTLNEIGNVKVTHSTNFWLKYDVNGVDDDVPPDGDLYDDNPEATATWGIFKGPNEFIYIREPW